MTTLLNATKVGDKYRDMSGMVATIMHVDADRIIVRRASRGWPTFTVFSADHSQVITSGLKTLKEALAA